MIKRLALSVAVVLWKSRNTMEGNLPVTSKTVFREDVVRHATRRDKIGIVLENGNDSESNSEYEDEEERVGEGLVLVSWYPKGDEEEIEEGLLQVVDRSWSQGEIARWKDPNKGSMKGIVSDICMKVNLRTAGALQPLAKNVNVNELAPLQKFYHELTFALGAWIGTVREVLLRLILKFRNGARCIVEGEQVNMLVDNTDNRDEDSPFYCGLFYPGQSLTGTSRVFRDVQWINGPRPVFSSNQRISCIVDEVTVSGLRVHWLERGYTNISTESSYLPPDTQISEETLSKITVFDHFNKTNIQIGDKAFYTLKEADIDLNKCPPDKEERIDLAQCSKVQPENKKSKHSSACKDQGREDDDEKIEENDSTGTDESADDEDSDHGNARGSRSSATVSSRRNEGRHQAAAVGPRSHANRKRRQFRRKKKKHQIPVKLVAGERVCVEVEATSKLLTITWQDGSKQADIPSTELLPVLHVDDFEFFPGDFVIDKTQPPSEADFGVVQKADSSQRTCKVKWMNRTENVYDDCVSVYDIGDHSDYSFKFGDVVFRLADEQNEENSEGGKEEVKATCGQVMFVDTEGNINVLWSDRTRSALPPQNLFVVHIDDWSTSGSHHSSSDEEWETTSEVSTDHEQLLEGNNPLSDMQILDDIGHRSVAALSNTNQNDQATEGQPIESQSASAEANEGSKNSKEDIHETEPDTKDHIEATANNDVKLKIGPVLSETTPNAVEKFSILEDLPASHRFASTTFQPVNPRQFNVAINREAVEMERSLSDGVYVRVFESRFDLGSIMIEGPAGTPYEDGLFIFDLQLPPDYPKSPPVVRYLSQCSERLNPNLYEDGTVCVSLLGTWNGKGSENWTKKSNLSQLILSLQGLILCEEPYFNEAGYEKHKGSAEGSENSRMYNEMVIIKVLQSLDRLIRNPSEAFKKEIMLHMKKALPRLFKRIYAWLKNFAPKDFLEKYPLSSSMEVDGSVSKPEFPLLPLSFGFCITLLRNLKSLENTAEKLIE